jgi:hypothetical protein
MAFLYVNSVGVPWTKHSFSAGAEFDTSASKYRDHRIEGWRERDIKASLRFGRALESAIQFFHENGGRGGFEEFTRLWREHENNKELVYTKPEKDWATLNRAGQEMMLLYKIKQPSLPIPLETSIFQREIEKEVFPGHPELGGITHAGKLDIIAKVDPNHPLLPKIQWDEKKGLFRPVIVDIKTSGKDFHERVGISALHAQLRNYSWLTGIRDVAILQFKKAGHALKKGSSVTLLTDSVKFKAGDEAVVCAVEDEQAYLVKNDDELELMNMAQGRGIGLNGKKGKLQSGKDADARRDVWLEQNADLVDVDVLTRQRLQFNAGIVKDQYAEDAGRTVARQITGIVNCWKSNSWPMEFGIGYPKDNTKDPYFRAFVEDDKMFREQMFSKSATDTFDDLIVVDEDPEEGGGHGDDSV